MIRANRRRRLAWSRTRTARFSDRLEMYGNGCPGSTARGVSTGKIWSLNVSRIVACAASSSSFQRTIGMPAAASAGRMSSANSRACVLASLRAPVDAIELLRGGQPVG